MRKCRNWQTSQTKDLVSIALVWVDVYKRQGYESVNEALAKMIPKAHEMGVKEGFDPFITLSFMALPVIPEIRITPRGIYLVKEDRMLRTPFS